MKYLCALAIFCAALVSIGCEAAGVGAMEAGAGEAMAAEGAAEGAAGAAEVGAEASLARGVRAAGGAEAAEAGARGGLSRFGEPEVRASGRATSTLGEATAGETGWRHFGDETARGTSEMSAESRSRASEASTTERSGLRSQANTYTVRIRGAQPFDGMTRHFDRQGAYRGYSVHTRDVSYHYDEAGRFDGRTEHRADGSLAWDSQGKFKGRSYDSGNITHVYDAAGKPKGYNTLLGNRIYYYDEHGTYTGYSTIEPGRSAPVHTPVVVVPAVNDCNNKPRTGSCATVGR